MPAEIRVLVFPVDSVGQLRHVRADLETFQALVGGHTEARRLGGRVFLFSNDDGHRLQLQPNRLLPGLGLVLGQFFLSAGDDGGLSVSLSADEVAHWARMSTSWPVADDRFLRTFEESERP